MTNSADPDQLVSSRATDLDLHCLHRLGYPSSVGPGLSLLCEDKRHRPIKHLIKINSLEDLIYS